LDSNLPRLERLTMLLAGMQAGMALPAKLHNLSIDLTTQGQVGGERGGRRMHCVTFGRQEGG